MAATDRHLFTSESVTEGHPDKLSDHISDAVLDAVMASDPTGRVACETLVTTGLCMVAGEITTSAKLDFTNIARETIRKVGYTRPEFGFDYQNCAVVNCIDEQSADIAMGVDPGGAGDQGLMFGFACDETPDLMPATLDYSHKILARMADDRKSDAAPFLEPDAKSQVTLRYENHKPVECTAVVVSTQHARGYDKGDKEAELKAYVKKTVGEILPEGWLTEETVWHINPTGAFEIGGPDGDAGLTGRKIIVDTYGGAAPHGGGAFSGKDPTKVDRSAAYITRYLAKNIVAAGLARRCTIQLAYAIGVSEPLSLYVDTHGTAKDGVTDEGLEAAIRGIGKLGGLTPRGIRTHLGLNKPIYRKSAAYGHFGRDVSGDYFPWERTDLVEDLKAAVG